MVLLRDNTILPKSLLNISHWLCSKCKLTLLCYNGRWSYGINPNYPDDMVLIADTEEKLQNMMNYKTGVKHEKWQWIVPKQEEFL